MSKKKHKHNIGNYYYQGKPTKKVLDMMCEMLHKGITVYHQYGKPTPPPCPPGGC